MNYSIIRNCLYFVDLTTFQILGQNLSNIFVGNLVQTMTPKGHFEINSPLKSKYYLEDHKKSVHEGLKNYACSYCGKVV